MLWTCSTGAGGAQPRILNYWIDGRRIRQKSLTIPLPQASRLVLLAGRVIVQGGDYSGPSVARCCPDLEVTLTYQWKRNRLVMTKKTVLPTSSDATLRSRATRGEAPLLREADAS